MGATIGRQLAQTRWGKLQAVFADILGLQQKTKSWDSGWLSLAVNSRTPLTHNLGVVPQSFALTAKCVVASDGYAVGDLVDLARGFQYPGAASVWGTQIQEMTTTTLIVWVGTQLTVYWPNKNTGAVFTPSPANWQVKVRAYVD